MEQELQTKDYGELSVQLSPIGEFYGSDVEGNPIPEKLTEKSLSALAEKLNKGDEILADIDHASTRVGNSRDSSAAGWFRSFIVQPLKGLFATLRLTKRGKELVENREYRYLSPTFILDENGEPIDLHSASFTNIPAFKGHITPILNQESNEILKDKECLNEETKEILTMDITKEELKELITSIISDMRAAEKAAEIKREVAEEVIENECSTQEKKDVVQNEVSEEETTTETTTEVPEEKVEEKEEVIKIESLNSAPMIKEVEPVWKKLNGQEFLDWANKHTNYKI